MCAHWLTDNFGWLCERRKDLLSDFTLNTHPPTQHTLRSLHVPQSVVNSVVISLTTLRLNTISWWLSWAFIKQFTNLHLFQVLSEGCTGYMSSCCWRHSAVWYAGGKKLHWNGNLQWQDLNWVKSYFTTILKTSNLCTQEWIEAWWNFITLVVLHRKDTPLWMAVMLLCLSRAMRSFGSGETTPFSTVFHITYTRQKSSSTCHGVHKVTV